MCIRSFKDNFNKYYALFERIGKKFSVATMKNWFKAKKTIKRDSIDEVTFNKKSAVVLVGVSAIGKSIFAKNFLKLHPEFKLISFDKCYFSALEEIGYMDNDVNDRAIELIDQKIREYKRKNIIVDGMVVSPEKRAALLNTLTKTGYKIHIVYFTQSYVKKHIEARFLSRAVDHILFAEMVDGNASTLRVLLTIDINMLENYAKRYNLTVSEVIQKFQNNSDVQNEVAIHKKRLEKELVDSFVAEQEYANAFMWGADYYYEIT